MKKLLIITMLDYQACSNNRVHHLIAQFRSRFDSITLMYKKNVSDRPFRQQLKTIWSVNTVLGRQENVTFLGVDPLLNYSHGLGITILKLDSAYRVPPGKIKKIFRRLLSSLGSISEFAVLPSFLWSYFFKVRESFDVFIGQGPWEMAIGYVLYKSGMIKLLIYDDFDYAPGIQHISKFRRWYTAKLENMMLKKAHRIISVGELLAQLRKEQTGRQAVIIPNGVDYKLFRRAQSKNAHPPTLIYTGYVGGWSGLELILEALARLKGDFPELRLVVLGHTSSYYSNFLQQRVSTLELEDRFFYEGNKTYSEMITYLKQADIGMALFQPVELRKYAFSIKVIEYMAAGLPVITTRDLQSACVVNKYKCGKAVGFEVDEVAEAITALLTNTKLHRKCVRNAVKASRDYDWKDLMEREYKVIETCYNQLSS